MSSDLKIPETFGATLAELRKSAKLSQSDLSRKLKLDPSRVSRLETGGTLPTPSEVEAYLDAIGNHAARDCRKFIRQPFVILPRPEFFHPDRAALCHAEDYLQRLDRFSAAEDVPGPLAKQANMYRDSLLRAARYLSDENHAIAYIGAIGVGKTTVACIQSGLVLADKAGLERVVLECGRGGTTICEVRIKYGPNLGLIVEPYPDAEVYRLTEELCAGVYDRADVGGDGEKQEKGVAREVNRALRNMAGLSRPRKKDSDRRSDPAVELATKFSKLEDFRAEVSARLKLWQRQRRELWYDETQNVSGPVWLRRLFAEINNGRNADFTLPQRITVHAPSQPLRICDYKIEIIDTKGVDRTAIRPDLKNCVDDQRTLTVLCSSFTKAPDVEMQGFIEHLKEVGADNALRERIAMLVLAHDDEALGMKDDAGVVAEDEQEGYELKRDQVEDELQRLDAGQVPIHFFNAKTEEPEKLTERLLAQIRTMRKAQAERIDEVAEAIDQLFRNRDEQHALAAQRDVNEALREFLSQHETLPDRKRFAHNSLLWAIRNLHARTVWATTRRFGTWPNLDVYYYLGAGAEVDAKLRVERTFSELEGVVKYMLGRKDLKPAHKFLKELLSNIEIWHGNFLEKVRRAGEYTYRPVLEDDTDLWPECEGLYARGLPYRTEVAEKVQGWFEDDERSHLHDQLEERIRDSWREDVLDPLAQLSQDVQAADVAAGGAAETATRRRGLAPRREASNGAV
jgi:transcriptional regulator with XRE-family HTH domain